MLPSQYLDLDDYEKAFVIASIKIKGENDKRAQDDAKKGKKSSPKKKGR